MHRLFWAIAVVTSFVPPSLGVETVIISGRVQDRFGNAIPNATVWAVPIVAVETTGTTLTGDDGRYRLAVPAGRYELHVQASGFQLEEAFVQALGTDVEVPPVVLKVGSIGYWEIEYHRAAIGTVLDPPSIQLVMEPISTTVCELVKLPERFKGRTVSVRGRVLIGFENFGLDSAECAPPSIVWLEYGSGPKRQPATWCCGDMIPRDPLPVVTNTDFKSFHRFLTAQSRKNGCHEGECYLYEVTATLTGRFDAVETVTCADGMSRCPKRGGYGHMGMASSRIVIGSVSDVSARELPRRGVRR